MKRMLVTGGAGFIGANYVRLQVEKNSCDELVVLDALTYAGNRASVGDLEREESIRFVHGDIRDTPLIESLLRDHGIDTLVHFAAESHVDRSIEGPDVFIDANVNGTHSLLKAARTVWLDGTPSDHRFHHVSTDEVYGTLSMDAAPFSEEHQYQPNSPYAASKAASDHIVRAYHHTFGLNVTTTNCSNNYGPYQFPEKLIPLMIVNILHGKPLPIYGDGQQIRDWLYVTDHCRAIDLALERGRAGEVYNIGGDNERPNLDIVHYLCRLLEDRFAASETLRTAFPDSPAAKGDANESLITYVADRPGHDRRYAINFSKAEAELGYAPLENFESGFARTIDWYLSEQVWWRKVMDGSYRDWIDSNYSAR
jgi:dTDP-glucose 4,6-dehydratase